MRSSLLVFCCVPSLVRVRGYDRPGGHKGCTTARQAHDAGATAGTEAAELRANTAGERGNASVTDNSMFAATEPKRTKFWPETYTGGCADKESFAEFLGQVETILSLVVPGLVARPFLIEFRAPSETKRSWRTMREFQGQEGNEADVDQLKVRDVVFDPTDDDKSETESVRKLADSLNQSGDAKLHDIRQRQR